MRILLVGGGGGGTQYNYGGGGSGYVSAATITVIPGDIYSVTAGAAFSGGIYGAGILGNASIFGNFKADGGKADGI